MNIYRLIRVYIRNLPLLIIVPIVLAATVIFLTRNPNYTFSSKTTIYTGIASGYSIEQDRAPSYFATNTAFDNIINIVKSRETIEEVSIRLLAQHLMMETPVSRYISTESYRKLQNIVPPEVIELIEEANNSGLKTANRPPDVETNSYTYHKVNQGETLYYIASKYDIDIEKLKKINSLNNNTIYNGQNLIVYVNSQDSPSNPSRTGAVISPYEKTVKKLIAYKNSSDTNFVYELLNFVHPHYSIKGILRNLKVKRIQSSDLLELSYNADDPGICRQTLIILTEVFIRNQRLIKENQSDAVVKYFENQLAKASERLQGAELELLNFNKDNNIINYYEQSKIIAVVKEELDKQYLGEKIKVSSSESVLEAIEDKLRIQDKIQFTTAKLIEKRNLLAEISAKIALSETYLDDQEQQHQSLTMLKDEAEILKQEIKDNINTLQSYSNNTDGLPISSLLSNWLNNLEIYEKSKAALQLLEVRRDEFLDNYRIFAPLGATLKRIEREINVSEREYLSILHGLNLAKLKLQNIELQSNIKTVDPPYFPLSPEPTKRKILVLAAAVIGFMLVAALIFFMEYFDNSIRTPARAERFSGLEVIGMYPRITRRKKKLNFPFISKRLIEMLLQNIILKLKNKNSKGYRRICVLSTQSKEGKTYISRLLAEMIKQTGKNVQLARVRSLKGETEDENIKQETETCVGAEISIDNQFSSITGFADLSEKYGLPPEKPGQTYIVELPSVLYYPYPSCLLNECDIIVLVCRANRPWTEADRKAISTLTSAAGQKPFIMLNGVEISELEGLLGELPKKRSRLRRIIKKMLHLQFYSRYKI